jgi:glycosyl transferase family 25
VIPTAYCINLDRRPDRWARSREVFASNGIMVERFSATDGGYSETLRAGEVGILRTHKRLIAHAEELFLDAVTIFEDDVELDLTHFVQYMAQVPNDWAFVYLGANHQRPIQHVSPNVARIVGSYALHAVIIRSSVYDAILRELEEEVEPVDVTYARLHERYPAYVFRPHIAWQRPSYSDILNTDVNYDWLKR